MSHHISPQEPRPSDPPGPTPSTPPSTPPVIRRAAWLWVSAATLCVLVAIAWLLLRKANIVPRGGHSWFVTFALGLMPFVVLFPLWYWSVRRLRRALFETRFRLCIHCAYDLSALCEVGTCPECGNQYDTAQVAAIWAAQGAPYTEPRPAGFTPWSPEEEAESPKARP